MAAGAPISSTVAGIAMGLVLEGKEPTRCFTDIAGAEDHTATWISKVAGPKTALRHYRWTSRCQNVTHAIMTEALEQARKARLPHSRKMNAAISTPRTTMSPYAPRIFTLQDPTE